MHRLSTGVRPLTLGVEFDQAMLRHVVQAIQDETNWLLEIVNLNIQNMQYTCAGDVWHPFPKDHLIMY